MAISFELHGLEAQLREAYDDLNTAARDALLIDAYRTGRISFGRLCETLEMSVSAGHDWLAAHGVGPNLDAENIADDEARLERFFARNGLDQPASRRGLTCL
ncbi:MAG TPA: UPF0175 family protein [Tepidisphaeraceae bacterium]|nr:UPF0175 family protein [Tepidisphaeraceae bacterium]